MDSITAEQRSQVDLLLPVDIARACEAVGERKVRMDKVRMAVLGGLAGAFISLGAMLFTVTMTATPLGFGPARLLGGLAFSLGLVLVICAGAELFTGNTLAVMAWASRRVSTRELLAALGIVYAANFAGALLTVGLMYATRQWDLGGAQIGATALAIAASKVNLGFGQAVALGVMCNVLVALAVWLSLGVRSLGAKVVAIVFPITAFVAAGFEHSIANMYFIPMGLLLKENETVRAVSTTDPAQLANLTWPGFLLHNLLPVTIGNVIGGAVLVGAVYWFIYLRGDHANRAP
jgi:formate/nitrite transporter